MKETTSATYRFLKKHKILAHEKYSNISFFGFLFLVPKKILILIVGAYSYSLTPLEPIKYRTLRAKCWRFIGCKVGKNVAIGRHVDFDYGNAHLIKVGDNVIITNGSCLLCHKRDNSHHYVGNNPHNLPYIYEGITIGDNCQIGTNVMIMPGVTIGEGAVIGANAVVTKDIPAWSVAVGFPAKVVKQLPAEPEAKH